jgi:hypothetical protein
MSKKKKRKEVIVRNSRDIHASGPGLECMFNLHNIQSEFEYLKTKG